MSVQNFKIKHGLNLGDHELIDPLGNINLPAGAAIQVDGAPLDALPDQTGQTGKFLSTNGSIASWDAITQYTPPTNQGAGNFLAGDGAYKPVTMPTLVSELVNDAGYQTSSQVATAVANLVDAAPNTLDTLNELAAALGDNPNFATTVSNQIGAKQDALVSGTNIKTVNGNSLLGSGNIAIATYTDTDVLNYLTAHQYATFDNVNQGLASRAELSGATFTGAVSAPSFSGDGHNLTNLDWTQIGNTPSSISTRNAYTASAGDTVFAATYTLGSVEVYLNGMHLMKDVDYTASNGTSITLTDPAGTGDEIEIIGFSTFNLVNVYNKTETDALITTVNNNLALKANQSTTYTKTEVDTSLATKANQSTTYTKTEVDTNLATKANLSGATFTGAITATAGTLTSLRNSGATNLGTNTFTKTSNGSDILLDNGTTDTPGLLMYYANNKNWGIDSYNNGSTQVLRFVSDLNESGGAIRAYLDNTGKMTATSFAGSGSQLTNVGASSISDGAVTASKLGSNAVFLTQFNSRTSQHSLGGDSGWVDHLSMTFTTNRTCNCLFLYSSSASYESGAVQGFARLILDGTMIGFNSAVAKQSTANSAGAGTCMWDRQNVSAGTHTVTVQLRNAIGGTTWITPYWSTDGQTANTLGVLYYGG